MRIRSKVTWGPEIWEENRSTEEGWELEVKLI